MTVDIGQSPIPVYIPKSTGSYFVSCIISADASVSGITSGTTIDVGGLKDLTAWVSRGVSTGAVELEWSPNGSSWYNWRTYSTGALPAAGEFVTQSYALSAGCFGFVRGIPNVSGTATSPIAVWLAGRTF